MNCRRLLAPAIFANAMSLLLFGIAPGVTAAESQPIAVTIDASKTHAPISKYVYGQFIEHIGGIINNGLWAEMLDDRKFYYPITSQPPAAAADPARGRRAPLRRWTPIGPDESILMDSNKPYVGDHSPLVKLTGTEPRGIRQTGLSLLKDESYSGRIVLAGEPTANVTVSLVWGPGANERQTIALGKLT